MQNVSVSEFMEDLNQNFDKARQKLAALAKEGSQLSRLDPAAVAAFDIKDLLIDLKRT